MTRVTSRLWATAAIGVAGALVLAAPAAASTVTIQDDAHVLSVTPVQNEAADLQAPIYIWTTTQDSANQSAFDQDVQAKVSNQFPLVLGINTAAHHEALRIGEASGFTQDQANAAASSANSAFDGVMRSRNDYTGAVQAALTSLHSSLAARSGDAAAGPGRSHGFGFGSGIVVLFVVIVVFGLLGRLFRGGRRRRLRGYGPPPGYGQGYGGGYGPGGPGYGGGYGQGYGGGMGPGAAAGLGAVGGGLLGYELGKEAGENEQFRRDETGGGYGDQGGFGGDGGGGWVTGQDSDFGGGGGDFGGGDSGGGAAATAAGKPAAAVRGRGAGPAPAPGRRPVRPRRSGQPPRSSRAADSARPRTRRPRLPGRRAACRWRCAQGTPT